MKFNPNYIFNWCYKVVNLSKFFRKMHDTNLCRTGQTLMLSVNVVEHGLNLELPVRFLFVIPKILRNRMYMILVWISRRW